MTQHDQPRSTTGHNFVGDDQKTAYCRAAVAPFEAAAERAIGAGNSLLLENAANQAARAAEEAPRRFDYVQEKLAGSLSNLAKFYNTGEPQMIIFGEDHPWDKEVIDNIRLAASAGEVTGQAEGRFKLPSDVQRKVSPSEDAITATAYDRPMAGGKLRQLHFRLTKKTGDQKPVTKARILLIAIPAGNLPTAA